MMHGQNKIAKYIENPHGDFYSGSLQVHEIFLTLQGEGPYSGERAVFIRLSGCHLRCHFCDTQWDDDNDFMLSVEYIVDKVKQLWGSAPFPFVVITGGEPARQPIDNLCATLHSSLGAHIQIETAGTFWRQCFWNESITVVVSPKTPTIDEHVRAAAHAFKYVISASDDFDDATGIPITATQKGARPAMLARPPSRMPRNAIFLSPMDEENEIKNAANRKMVGLLALKHGYTAGVQLHKFMELP